MQLISRGTVGRCEFLIVDVKSLGSCFVRYVLIYRPPDIDVETSLALFNVIHDHLDNVKLFVIMEDFNLPDIS